MNPFIDGFHHFPCFTECYEIITDRVPSYNRDDFSEYFSGARYCISKSYAEKFKYFAPIYLNKEIPEKFVIFKINSDDVFSIYRTPILRQIPIPQT